MSMLKAPAVTEGEWTLCRRLYGKELQVVGFHIAAPKEGSRAPVCQSGLISLPEIEANAKMLAASKKLAEALVPFAALLQNHNSKGDDSAPIFGINDAIITRKHLLDAVAALLASGYTEEP